MPSVGPDPVRRTSARPGREDSEVGETLLPTPLNHRPSDGLDIYQERLELRRLDVGIADEGRERIRPETLLGFTHETPVQGNSNDMHRLAVANQRTDALGDNRLRLY